MQKCENELSRSTMTVVSFEFCWSGSLTYRQQVKFQSWEVFLLLISCHWSHIKPSYCITKVYLRKLCWLAFPHTHLSMSDFRPYQVSIYIWWRDHQTLNNARTQSQLPHIAVPKIHCTYKGARKWLIFLDWYSKVLYSVMCWKGYLIPLFTKSFKQNRLK